MLGIEGLKDASFQGDLRWARTAKWTGYAPWVVLVIGILSMVEIALGAVWIASLKTDLSFAQVIQPLIAPGLSFFNAIPSLHLHVLARVNPPRLALWFSVSMALIMFISSIFFMGACVGNHGHGSVQRYECPSGTGGNSKVWDAMVALQFLSAILYACTSAMAWKVKRALESRDGRIAAGLEMVTQEEKERRESEARERWRYLQAG
ncbi:hypothetical protein RBB50_006192 [Rhinocladiella similis]